MVNVLLPEYNKYITISLNVFATMHSYVIAALKY